MYKFIKNLMMVIQMFMMKIGVEGLVFKQLTLVYKEMQKLKKPTVYSVLASEFLHVHGKQCTELLIQNYTIIKIIYKVLL